MVAPAHCVEIATGVFRIDLGFAGMPDVIVAYLIGNDDDWILFETGPTTTLSALESGVAAAGVSFDQIRRIVVSHIHLDHAGAAGVLLRNHPHLRLAVHPVGAPHMAAPEKLVNSAARIYGDQMDTLWGEIAPIPADRIDTLADGDRFTVGNHDLLVRHAAGHASHHLILHDATTNVLFTGDVAGVRIPGTRFVTGATAPPELDPVAWETSVNIMRELNPGKLALTHAGVFEDVQEHLDQVMPVTNHFIDLARDTFTAGGDLQAVIAALQEFLRQSVDRDEVTYNKLELADPTFVSALGLQRYLRKRGDIA